ncbi:LLM class flavin-dependent oxidoreductase [Streptomyces sp. NPDC020983]|uniref:LLM class flavin-dependent oxidoreductase n=1 Tax=Streptomyces sp. NPDC020983 TaxID=3365106 RepID=UPI00378F28AF
MSPAASPPPVAPLSVLDLVPVSAGGTPGDAVRRSIDLARRAEAAGYHRYWLAEHHLSPGLAGASPAVTAALVASATERIRVGSGAVQLGHHTPLSVVEQFGLVEAAFPGRVDIGLGRSPSRPSVPPRGAGTAGGAPPAAAARPAPAGRRLESGLYLPPPYRHPPTGPVRDRTARMFELITLPGAEANGYARQVDDILGLLAGTHRVKAEGPVRAVPGEGARVEVWVVGSSAGESAEVAGARGLPFAASYHISPGTVLEAVDAYRKAFRPSAQLAQPRVLVSADVVVGTDDAHAAHLALPFGRWVLSSRVGEEGAIPFPSPAQAAAEPLTPAERELVADRVETQVVGSAATVAAKLRVLQEATGADELIVTTITHDHADRVRSYELLAREWYG